MKKIIALLLALMLLVCCAACGTGAGTASSPEKSQPAASNPAPAPAPDGEAAPAPDAQPDAEPQPEGPSEPAAFVYDLPLVTEPTEFKIWTKNFRCFAYYDGFEDCLWWQELENRTGVHIDFNEYSGAGPSADALMLMVAGGDVEYDAIVDLGSLYTGGEAQALEDGLIVDLAPYMEENAPNYRYVLNSSDTYKKNTYTDNGNMLAFYQLWDMDTMPMIGLVIRYDWLEDLGREVPVTYDDVHDALTAFKTEKNADSALWINNSCCNVGGMLGNGYGIDTFYGQNEGLYMLYQVDGQIKYSPVEEGYREYIGMLSQWYSEGLIYPDFMSYTEQMMPDMSLLGEGRTGMLNGIVDMLPMFEMASNGGKFGGLTDPVKTAGETTHFAFSVNYVKSGCGFYITEYCKNVPLLMQWCDYLYSEEGSFFKRYGIEGQSFEYVDGEPTLIADAIYKSYENAEAGLDMYLGGDAWGLDSTGPRIVAYNDMQKTCIEAWSKADAARKLPAGLSLTPEEAIDFSDKFMDIDTFVMENVASFVSGNKSMDEWDEFVGHIREMGIDDALAIYQAAMDRYSARG